MIGVLSKVAQIRHLSEMSGNFVIADRNKYANPCKDTRAH
jgi:hypothetical protein